MPRQGLRVTIWNEHVHKREDARVAAISPEGIHGSPRGGSTGWGWSCVLRPAMVEAAITAARHGGWVEVARP